MRLAAPLVAIAFTLAAGCAGPRSLVSGQSSEAEVRARMGAPTDTRTEANGDKVWEYATGPEGFHTHQVHIGADGRVRQVTQMLTEERFVTIVPGQATQAEVRNLLGRPMDDTTFRAGRTWSWRFLRGGVSPGYMVVSFNTDGTVRERIVIIDPTGESPPD